jgi:mono/diheme cytochrome c family protein
VRRWALVLLLLPLAACDQMDRQPRYDAFGRASLFGDGQANQPPPAGTVAQEDAAWQAAAATRPPMSAALLARGRGRYDIDCVQCHGPAGDGDGVIPSRGYPRPESFHTPRLRALTSRQVVAVITKGYGVMYPHGDRVAPADRWAIAAYVQALQLSQAAPIAALSPDDRRRIEVGDGG